MQNAIENNVLNSILSRAPRPIVDAIKSASEKVGVDFSYLVEQAQAESSFNAKAEAKTSSATGLYQFIESTWMNMVEKYGDKYGIDTEGKSRQELLDLRKDAKISCYMAAEFANENAECLERNWAKGEKEIGSTELYFAHFMGANGASSFLNARDENPDAIAANLFPTAAKANKNVFYDRDTGAARTLDEVYAFFDKKFSGAKNVDMAQVDKELGVEPVAASGSLYRSSPLGSIGTTSARAADIASLYTSPNFSSSSLAGSSLYKLISNPVEVLMLAQMDTPFLGDHARDKRGWF